MKILISGGHITPAIAFIQFLQQQDQPIEVIFAGREYSQDQSKQKSREKEEIEKFGVTFIQFRAPRMALNSLESLIKLILLFPVSLVSAIQIVIKHKPSIFVSFGSYQAVPLAVASWLMRVPVITHEQTRSVGMANRLISFFARKIAISFEETAKQLPKYKAVFTGNLIRKNLLNTKVKKPTWINSETKKPILYITGGNQGSEIINTTVGKALSRLTKRWFVIHQCGNRTKNRNYKGELQELQKTLPSAQKFSYLVREWLNEQELQWVYQNCRIILSRSGANTLQEIQYHQLPSVLIPLPFSRGDEQLRGAEFLSKKGGAYLLHQKDLSAESLIQALLVVEEQYDSMKLQLKQLPVITNADKALFDLVLANRQQ